MNNPAETERGKRPRRVAFRLLRFGIQLLVFLIFVGLSAFLLRPLQRFMHARMGQIRDELLSRAELYLGRRIEYSSLAPSVFGALDIRGIRIYASAEDPALTIDRFRVAYSFRELARGEIAEAIRSVRIDRPRISLDLKRDADLRDRFVAEGSSSGADSLIEPVRAIAALIPEGLLVRVRGGEFRLLADGGALQVEGLNFETRAEAGNFAFSGKWSARAELAGLFNQTLGAVMSGRVDGELFRDLRAGGMQLQIPAFSGDFFVFRTMTVNIALTEQGVEIRKINDPLPMDFSLRYDFETRRISGSLRAEDFSPRDLVTFTGPWGKYNPYLALRSTGHASIDSDSRGEPFYELDLAGSLGNEDSEGFSYAVAGRGNRSRFEFSRCVALLPQGELSYSGGLGLDPLMPDGTLRARNFSLGGDGGINGDFVISSSGRTIEFFGESVSLGTVELAALDGALVREDQDLSFSLSALRFRNVESYEDVQLSSLSLEGALDWKSRRFQGSLALDSFAVLDIMNAVRSLFAPDSVPDLPDYIAGNVSITTEIFVSADSSHILYNAPRLVAVYSGGRDIYALVSVSGTDRRFELSQGRVAWAEGSAEAAGFADFSDPDDIAFSFRASYQDMHYYLDGEYLDRRSLSVRGSYGFQMYVSAMEQGGYSGYAEASSFPIPGDGQAMRLSFLMSLRYNNPRYWSVAVDHFDVQDLRAPVSPITSLGISGEINEGGLLFWRMVFDDGQGPMNGRAVGSWGDEFSRPSGELVIRNQQGAEIVRLRASYDGNAMDVNFSGTGLQVGRFLRNPYGAVFTGNGGIHWQSWNSYSAEVTLEGLSARVGDSSVAAAGSISLNQDEITLRALRVEYNTLEITFDELRVDRLNSYASAAAQIRGGVMGRPLDLAFNTDLDFAPVDSWLSLPRAIDVFSGALFVQNLRWEDIHFRQAIGFVFSRNHSQVSLSGGPDDMLRMQIASDGAFYASLASPAPFRGSLVGVVTGKTIDVRTTNLYADLGSLWRFIPGKEMVNVPGGIADISAEIRGSLGDPEFFGTARVYGLRLSVPQYLRADIEPVAADITLEGNEMRFGPVPARVGGGAGVASGWFRFDRWAPTVFVIDVKVPLETPIPFGVDIAGVQADGDASGHLVLGMEDSVFRINGDLTGNNTEINLDTQQFSWQALEAGEMGEDVGPVIADLRIVTGPKVEFVYPSREFPVIRANAEAGTALRITSDTLSRRFTVEGDVGIRSGEIFYFQRSFYIREGILSFNESNEQFDPSISARAETRDRTDDGPVIVSLIVDNSPLRSFTPRLESNPALSQFEILSLLGQNFTGTPSENPNESIRSMVYASGDFLTQFYAYRRLERLIRDFARVDMFSIRTQILQNMFIQATGLRDPVDTNGGVGNYFDNTAVFLGKYFGPDIFGQAMLSFRYDENRTIFGDISQGGLTLGGGVSLEADIGVELRGPLFDIQINFAPRHLENMFVDDLSFTLLWKRSIKSLSDLWKEP